MSDFDKLNELFERKEKLYKAIFEMIYNTCKDKSMKDYEKIEKIEEICEKLG